MSQVNKKIPGRKYPRDFNSILKNKSMKKLKTCHLTKINYKHVLRSIDSDAR